MDTDKAEELLRSYYAMRTAEAKARGPRGVIGDQAAASGRRRETADRYAGLDSPLAALALAAAALAMMAGFGLACQRWEARPISTGSLSLLAELRVGADDLDKAMEAVRESAPRRDTKGERL